MLDPVFAGAAAALGIDHIKTFAPLGDHLTDDFGRILKIHVHDDDGVTRGVLHPGQRSHRLAEAAREFQELDARIVAAQFKHDLLGAIRRRVHGEDDFVTGRDWFEQRADPADEFRDVALLPIDRNHNRQHDR